MLWSPSPIVVWNCGGLYVCVFPRYITQFNDICLCKDWAGGLQRTLCEAVFVNLVLTAAGAKYGSVIYTHNGAWIPWVVLIWILSEQELASWCIVLSNLNCIKCDKEQIFFLFFFLLIEVVQTKLNCEGSFQVFHSKSSCPFTMFGWNNPQLEICGYPFIFHSYQGQPGMRRA